MKKFLLLSLFVLLAVSASAQTIKPKSYKGFVDAYFVGGNDGVWKSFNTLGGGVLTSHGYQINQNVFVGGGTGIFGYGTGRFLNTGYLTEDAGYSIPFFANARFNMNRKKVSPYFDVKIGYSVGSYSGLFANPSFGVRIGIKDNIGFNISLGYMCQGYLVRESHHYYFGTIHTYDNYYINGFNFSVGVDF